MDGQPTADVIEQVKDIPIYRDSVARGHFPVLEKPEIARGFPDNWMTPRLEAALATGAAEYVLSTGTNHARMQLIRPPYFLLRSYYRLWSEHPDIAHTWRDGCRRASLTTVLATEHVARVNAKKRDGGRDRNAGDSSSGDASTPGAEPSLEERRLDERTVYLNLRLDPALWERADVERMLGELRAIAASHPEGRYHLDCSGYHLAHLVRHAEDAGLWENPESFPRPASIITAYEYTPRNVRRFLESRFDCPVVDLFGSTELGYLFYSDRTGSYRPYLEGMSVELLPVAPGSTLYSLIVTSVRNPHMPLVRYRSGDCARTRDGSPDPEKIVSFCGREKELLDGPNGPVAAGDLDERVATAAPRVFVHQLLLPEAEAEGRGPQSAVLRCTTFDGKPLGTDESEALGRSVSALTGRACRVEHRDHIPIGASGKYAWLARS
ncbi:hypothetical protein [Streptomyces sp. NPDC001661]